MDFQLPMIVLQSPKCQSRYLWKENQLAFYFALNFFFLSERVKNIFQLRQWAVHLLVHPLYLFFFSLQSNTVGKQLVGSLLLIAAMQSSFSIYIFWFWKNMVSYVREKKHEQRSEFLANSYKTKPKHIKRWKVICGARKAIRSWGKCSWCRVSHCILSNETKHRWLVLKAGSLRIVFIYFLFFKEKCLNKKDLFAAVCTMR